MMLRLLLLLLLFAPAAGAQESAPGWDAYRDGDYNGARQLARSAGTAEGFALACRAGLVVGGFYEQGNAAVASLHRALADCEAALEIDPANYVAGLSHAIALGFEGRRLRKVAYARASKRGIEALIARYPDNALAQGALAGWHAEVAREGFFARLVLGASRGRAERLYRKASELPTAALPLAFEHIRFLARGGRSERVLALKEAEKALAATPEDAFEVLLQQKIEAIRAAIAARDKAALKEALKEAMPFDGIGRWRGADPHPILYPEGP